MQFRERRLDNGLEIVAECNGRAYSTALGFFVNAGSRDETDELSGVSHFLEHMVFKGTARRTAADVNRELDEIGSFSNARTSEERTVYYAAVLPEFQDRLMALLSDLMRPSLRQDDFDLEKQVILEEIRMYQDQPPFGGHEKCMAAYFRSHPLARSILGTAESIGSLTAQQMRAYFRQRYSPGNITLVAAGNVDFDALVAGAEQHCGHWEPLAAPRQTPRASPHASFHVVHQQAATQQYVIQIADGPAAEDEQRYAGLILTTVLGDESGSQLYWELVDPGRAEYANMVPYAFQGTGIFMTFLCCAPEDAADNLQRLRAIHRAAESDGVTEEELTRAKNKIIASIILQAERPANRLFAVGVNRVQRRQYRTVQETVAAYQAVTREAVTAVLERYPPSVNTTLAIGPLKELEPPP